MVQTGAADTQTQDLPAELQSSLRTTVQRIAGTDTQKISLILSTCRSGSTAVGEAFARSGKPIVYQATKEWLRAQIVDFLPNEEFEKTFPKTLQPFMRSAYVGPESAGQDGELLMKETLGPFHPWECSFDPLGTLLKAGWTPDQIRVVVLVRDPRSCFASWIKVWGKLIQGDEQAAHEKLAKNFIMAFQMLADTVELARAEGCSVKVMLMESLEVVYPPAEFFGSIVKALNMAMPDELVKASVSWPAGESMLLKHTEDQQDEYLKACHGEGIFKSTGLHALPVADTLPPNIDALMNEVLESTQASYTKLVRLADVPRQ
jgi:hypothetical protein